MADHLCHAHGCDRKVTPKMLFCRPHWFATRKVIQRAIWAEYRPGQEITKTPSLRYLAVQRRAVAELVFKPLDEAAARVAAPYLLESEVWRRRAIDAGLGDPLEGISRTPVLTAEQAEAVANG